MNATSNAPAMLASAAQPTNWAFRGRETVEGLRAKGLFIDLEEDETTTDGEMPGSKENIIPNQPPPAPPTPTIEPRAPIAPNPYRVQLKPYARSLESDMPGSLCMLGLPHATYQSWKANGYQHDWVERIRPRLRTNVLYDFPKSKYKLSDIVKNYSKDASRSALRVGDILFVVEEYRGANGHGGVREVQKSAVITTFLPLTAHPTHHEMALTLYYNTTRIPGEYIFRGPRELAKTFAGMVPQGHGHDAWDSIQVDRQGVWLGSLGDVRQKYHRWCIEMSAWSGVSGERFGKRQGPRR